MTQPGRLSRCICRGVSSDLGTGGGGGGGLLGGGGGAFLFFGGGGGGDLLFLGGGGGGDFFFLGGGGAGFAGRLVFLGGVVDFFFFFFASLPSVFAQLKRHSQISGASNYAMSLAVVLSYVICQEQASMLSWIKYNKFGISGET